MRSTCKCHYRSILFLLSSSTRSTSSVQRSSDMISPKVCARSTLLYLIFLLLTSLTNCQCNTDQNPYCAGNSQFEQLCCTYPNICYWSNRNGDPACCQAGSDCRGDGGPAPTVVVYTAVQQTTVQTTYLVQTVYTTTTPQYSTVTYYSNYAAPTTTYVAVPPPMYTSFSTVVTPAVVVITETAAVVGAVTTQGVFVTFAAVQNGALTVGLTDCWSLGVLVACAVSLSMTFLI